MILVSHLHLPRALATTCMIGGLCLPNVAAGRATGAHVVTVVATDFAFQLPASIPAGPTTFRLVNHGKQVHQLSMMRLDSGKTASEAFAALLKAGRGARPAWMHPVGGPNAVAPGGESSATLAMEPGSYMLFCEVPGPTPTPHFALGMLKAFVVRAPSRHAVPPHADLTLKLTDYDFVFSHPLTSGLRTIAVVNAASQPHMLVIYEMPSDQPLGANVKSLLAWSRNPDDRPPPGTPYGGVTEISPGSTAVMTEKFEPGTYLLMCFVRDAKDGKPHFMHGMQKQIVVQ